MKLSIVLCTSSPSQLRKEISKWVALCVFLLQGVYKICCALHLMRAVVSTCLLHGACIACAAMPMSHVARACIYTYLSAYLEFAIFCHAAMRQCSGVEIFLRRSPRIGMASSAHIGMGTAKWQCLSLRGVWKVLPRLIGRRNHYVQY